MISPANNNKRLLVSGKANESCGKTDRGKRISKKENVK
jgi:hypothetical protein